jgi:beta-lactamase class A
MSLLKPCISLRFRFVAATIAGGLLLSGHGSAAQARDGMAGGSGLKGKVEGLMKEHHGKVALYGVQLKTGETLGIDSDLPVQTASDIKLAMLYYAMQQVRAGKARWDEKLVLKPGDPVSGSGMLTFFDTPLTVTLKDVLTLMVIVSDNTATNMAIDRFGVDPVNAEMTRMGLVNTHLYKKVMKPATVPMPADQPKFGLGKTTPYEMVTLMARIGRCQLHPLGERKTPTPPVSDEGFAAADAQDLAVCETGLKMLRNQFYRETIPRYLETVDSSENGTAIASKTGSLNSVRNDVAIVAGKSGPIVLAIFTYDNADHGWTVDNEGEVTIAKLAKVIVNAWSPEGIDGRTLVPGLGLASGK